MSIDPKAGALGNLPIGKRKRALWRAFKRDPADPRLFNWLMDRQRKRMADSLCRMMMGDFKKSLTEDLPFIGLGQSMLGLNDKEWKSVHNAVTVSPTELEPT